jgi:hypothetical protein
MRQIVDHSIAGYGDMHTDSLEMAKPTDLVDIQPKP